jgi:hypothetical protein
MSGDSTIRQRERGMVNFDSHQGVPMKRIVLHSSAILCLTLLSSVAWGACHVIIPNGSGNGSGSDWNNACNGFSGSCSGSNMVRGDTYYLGKGAYSSPTLSKSNSGATLITIQAPTVADHCTNTGFVQATHVGQADLAGSLFISSDYWKLDGQYGTEAPGAGKGTFGIKIHWNGGTSQMPIAISGGGTGSTFRFLEVQGSNGADTGCDVGIRILGYNDTPNTNSVLIEHNYIYRSNNIVGVQVSSNITVQNNILSENWSTASCHGENIAINGADNLTIRNNRFINCVGTGCIATPSSLHLAMSAFEVYGNVFYDDGRTGSCPGNFDCPGNGMIAIIDSVNVTGAKIYNNVVANWTAGHTSSGDSLTLFQTGSGGTITGLDLRNNVFYNNVAMTASDITPATCSSNSYYNTTRSSSACTGDVTGLSGSPFVNAATAPQDFHLVSDTAAWSALPAPYSLDVDGLPRISSRGAFQFGKLNTNAPPEPPTNLTAEVH